MIDPVRCETPSLASTWLRNDLAAPMKAFDDVTMADGTTAQTFFSPPGPAAATAGASVAVSPAMTGTVQPSLLRAARMAGVAPPSSITTSAFGCPARRPERADAAPAPDIDTDACPVTVSPSAEAARAKPAAPWRLVTSRVTTTATFDRSWAAANLAI